MFLFFGKFKWVPFTVIDVNSDCDESRFGSGAGDVSADCSGSGSQRSFTLPGNEYVPVLKEKSIF